MKLKLGIALRRWHSPFGLCRRRRVGKISGDVVKIGVLNDQSSLYADITGPGSVAAARLAVEDFGGTVNGKKIEIVFADHQNKPDVGANIARQWIDRDGVDTIVDVPTSSVALAWRR
jgi:branched-chain amino acid transport system substrate-binding protein